MFLLSTLEGANLNDVMHAHKGRLEILFSSLDPWNESVRVSHKCVWVRCSGLPLHLWSEECFAALIEPFGSLVTVDRKTLTWECLEYARFLVRTPVGFEVKAVKCMEINDSPCTVELQEEARLLVTNEGLDVDSSESVNSDSLSSDFFSKGRDVSDDENWEDLESVDGDIVNSKIRGGSKGVIAGHSCCYSIPVAGVADGSQGKVAHEGVNRLGTGFDGCMESGNVEGRLTCIPDIGSHSQPLWAIITNKAGNVLKEWVATPSGVGQGSVQEVSWVADSGGVGGPSNILDSVSKSGDVSGVGESGGYVGPNKIRDYKNMGVYVVGEPSRPVAGEPSDVGGLREQVKCVGPVNGLDAFGSVHAKRGKDLLKDGLGSGSLGSGGSCNGALFGAIGLDLDVRKSGELNGTRRRKTCKLSVRGSPGHCESRGHDL